MTCRIDWILQHYLHWISKCLFGTERRVQKGQDEYPSCTPTRQELSAVNSRILAQQPVADWGVQDTAANDHDDVQRSVCSITYARRVPHHDLKELTHMFISGLYQR